MNIMLIVLKNTQQIICEAAEKEGALVCHKPLVIGWQPNQKKKGLELTLSEYPPLIIHLVKDAESVPVIIHESDMRVIYYEDDIKPEVLADYERRKQEVYGTVAIVHTMPGALQGRA